MCGRIEREREREQEGIGCGTDIDGVVWRSSGGVL